MLVGLRVLTLLALAAMLAEPVLVSSRRETVRSHLALIVDDSTSQSFSDPYSDNSRAVELAAHLRLESVAGKSPVDRLRETPRLDLVKQVVRPHLKALAKGRELALYDLETAARGGAGTPEHERFLDEVRPNAARCRPWATRLRRFEWASRPAGRGGDHRHRRPLQHRGRPAARAVEAALRQNIPVFPIAAGRGGRLQQHPARGYRG